eukprot:5114374-Alexandrium_andersonii.AAC.1
MPSVRSRYVAKDIAFNNGDSAFAANPPLEALRLLLSDLATLRRAEVSRRRCGARKTFVIDARNAHLRA